MKRNKSVPKKAGSVKWKLFLYLVVFTGIILLILWVFQVVLLDDFYKAIKLGQIKSNANTIANHIDKEDFVPTTVNLAIRNDMCVVVLDKNMKEYVSVPVLKDCYVHSINPIGKYRLYQIALQNGGESLQRLEPSQYINYYYSVDYNDKSMKSTNELERVIYTKIIQDKNGNEFVLMLNTVISPVTATVATLNIQLGLISGVLLILASLFAWILSKKISKPIIQINESAKIMANGTYEANFAANDYKEIAELANTLNHTSHELSKAEGLRRELIANISHDLRTPLTMIIGYGEVMRDLPDENSPENIQIIIDEAKRLNSLVNDVLDLSKLQSGTQAVQFVDLNLTEIIEQALLRYTKLKEQDGYQISFLYQEKVTVYGDETRILQVLYNLVNNAINYTGEDKTVVVTQTVTDTGIRIAVKDSGEGIPEDKLPYIWDRYYKVDKVHKRAAVGTGLGLSIVKSIMDLHHGRYGVSSTNEGATFWIEFDPNQKNQ